jgi:hypothetical protein
LSEGAATETTHLREIVLNDLRSTDDEAKSAFDEEFDGELIEFAEATTAGGA